MATITATTTFNRVTGKIVIVDTTNYLAQGYDFSSGATASGFISVEYNTGAGWIYAYNNYNGSTPDLDPATSTTATCDIDIPYGTDGKPLPVEYRLNYRVDLSDGVTDTLATFTDDYTYSLVDPDICIDVTHNCAGSTITSQDSTTYTQTGVTVTSLVRAHTLYPPPTSQATALSGDLVTLIYTPLWTRTWSAEVITTITYLQDDGLYVTVQYNGVKEHKVVCDDSLQRVLCCVNDANTTLLNLQVSNPVKAQNFRTNHYQPAWNALTLYLAAQQAGDEDVMAAQYDSIVSYLGCEDCGCDSEISVLVQGTSQGSQSVNVYNVDSPDSSITVTSEVSGGITTFHIQLSAALQLAIAQAATQINIGTNTSSYISITPATVSDPTTYVDYIGPDILQPYTISKQLRLTKNLGAGAYFLVDHLTVGKQSSIWADDASQTFAAGTSSPNASGDIAVLFFQTFLQGVTTAPQGYTAHAQVIRYKDAATPYSAKTAFECKVLWFDDSSLTGDIAMILYDPATGFPLTLAQLNSATVAGQTIYISLDIEILPYGVTLP